jgi:hypothetical protein
MAMQWKTHPDFQLSPVTDVLVRRISAICSSCKHKSLTYCLPTVHENISFGLSITSNNFKRTYQRKVFKVLKWMQNI